MKFDIKDVKSWNTRNDVKIGDEGYFCNHISDLYDMRDIEYSKIERIRDNQANCFSSTAFYGDFSFFLPLNNELEKTLNKVNRSAHQFMCVGNDIFIRDKNQMTHLMITRIDRDVKTNEVINVNGMSPIYLFNNYEIRVGAEWLPFGVEVKDE